MGGRVSIPQDCVAPAPTIWRRMLHRWGGRLPFRRIDAESESSVSIVLPLFERYHVCSLPGWLGGGEVYLHHYLRSDPDRGMHDHPWAWAIAIPLAGGYVEQRLERQSSAPGLPSVHRPRRPFRPYRLTGDDFHRVVIPQGYATSWSLFITARNVKGWGFIRPDPPSGVRYDLFAAAETSESKTKWWRTAPPGRLHRRAPA
jgi:hypothetical protein